MKSEYNGVQFENHIQEVLSSSMLQCYLNTYIYIEICIIFIYLSKEIGKDSKLLKEAHIFILWIYYHSFHLPVS